MVTRPKRRRNSESSKNIAAIRGPPQWPIMEDVDEGIKELFQTLIEGQARTDKSVGTLAGLIGESHGLLETALLNSNKLFEAAHLKTEEVVQKYVEAAEARMRRIEENLDGLIRAISSEPSNGKNH